MGNELVTFRLLADHGAGRPVVDIEVARRAAEPVGGVREPAVLSSEDGTREGVRRRAREAQRLLHATRGIVVVDADREEGREVLVGEDLVRRVAAHSDSGPDEEALAVVTGAAREDRHRGVIGHLTLQPLQPAVGAPVDDGSAPHREVGDIAVDERLGLRDELVAPPPASHSERGT